MWIDDGAREVHLKIVYTGTALAGRSSSLQYIHAKTRSDAEKQFHAGPGVHGWMVRTEFLVRSIVPRPEHRLRLHLHCERNHQITAPANFIDPVREVLRGADGLVLVADSHELLVDRNRHYFALVDELLREQGVDPAVLPRVYYHNKRDLPEAVPLDVMNADLNPEGRPWFAGSVWQGSGVFEALRSVVEQALARG